MNIVNLRPGEGRRISASRRRRPKTVGVRRLTRERGHLVVLNNGADGGTDDVTSDVDRLPALRSECKTGYRPCPFVSCRFHLYLDVTEHGAIKLNFPDQEPWEMKTSCALDVAEAGDGLTLEELGGLLNLTRERTRQIERLALDKVDRGLDEMP